MVTRAKSGADFERAFRRRFGRTGRIRRRRFRRRPCGPWSEPQGRAAAGAALRPARALRVRARRAHEGPRDPDGRGAALQLDRQGDRPAGRGARRRHGAGEEPRAAADPVPPRRAERRPHREVLARRRAQQAHAARARGGASGDAGGARRPRACATSATRTGRYYCYPTCGGIETLVASNTVAVPHGRARRWRPATTRARTAGRWRRPRSRARRALAAERRGLD